MDTKRKYLSSSSEEQADCVPLAKKQREISRRDVCIICRSVNVDDEVSSIFIVNLDSFVNEWGSSSDGSLTPRVRDPMLQLRHGEFDVFCVLGSTLYVIDGSWCKCTIPRSKSVFTYDLSSLSADVFDLKLNKSMLHKAPPMHRIKCEPYAIATPDGKKILVFSSQIGHHYHFDDDDDEIEDKCDFELYDPAEQAWRKLPGIPDRWRRPTADYFSRITAFTFISESVLFLQTDIGMFSLDLQSLDNDSEGWEQLTRFCGFLPSYIPRFCGGSFSLIGDGLILTPFDFCDFRLPWHFSIPGPSSPFDDYSFHGRYARGLTILGVGNGECNFCIGKAEQYEGKKYICLTVDEYKFELDEYNVDPLKYSAEGGKMAGSLPHHETKIPGTKGVKTFKFLIKADYYSPYCPLMLFAVGAGTN